MLNTHETMPAQFTRNADLKTPGRADAAQDREHGSRRMALHAVDATRIATALLGDSIATNLFTLGFAYQKGLIPISRAGDRAGDPPQWRGGEDESRRLPVGPPHRA